ncbi:hypothetical protein EUTSA_v10010004mg [Eutrema salsugineum]|uniref:Pectinesterase inhibitor domain-containing protein n=1 Tax=Eutrema salsugineum TaxID=72664 RepID=V4L7F0_EUTSA|nr:hypothetical protein EUTSA_v10010004mg [Eutrema salsugineum]
MVAYLRKNVLLVFIVAILFFVVSSYARFSMMVTKSEIDSTCKDKYFNSSLCFDVLNSTPNIGKLDFSGLTKVLISHQFRNISNTLKQIKMSEGNSTDWQAINLCGLRCLNVRITGVSTDIETCMDAVSTMKPIPQFLIMESTVINNIGSIILKILECYIRKEKIRCY